MKGGSLFFLIILISTQLQSQKYIVDISENIINPNDYKIKIDTIIDVRDEKECIGYVFKGLSNRATPAYLYMNFIDYLNGCSRVYTEADNYSEHIIIRINRLLIYEQLYLNVEYSMVEMNISFIVKKQEKYYEKYQASAFITNRGIDATYQHSENIFNALKSCFEQFYQRNNLKKLEISDQYQETDLNTNPLRLANYAINTRKSKKRGIYGTFADFRDNTIDTSIQFTVDYIGEENGSITAIIKGNDNKKIKEIWGFSDGEYDFVRLNNKFYSLLKENNTYNVYNYPPDFESKIMGISYIGGLFFTTLYMSVVKKIKYSIDLTCGRFYSTDHPKDFKIESKIIVLYSYFSKTNDEIELFVNNKSHGSFTRGTYKVLNFKSEVKDVDICVKYNDKKECLSIKPILFNTDLYLVKIKKEKIILDRTPKNVRKTLISDIKNGEYVEMNK